MRIDIVEDAVRGVSPELPVRLSTFNGWVITIESKIQVSTPASRHLELDSEDSATPGILTPVVSGRTILMVDVTDGVLRLEFDGEVTVSVQPDADFESWNLVGPGGERFVCMPGGELVHWSPQ